MSETAIDPGTARLREIIAQIEAANASGSKPARREFDHLRDIAFEDVVIEGPNGPVEARRYRGSRDPQAGMVWIHGGAFIAGDLDMPESHWVSLELAARGIGVLALDYRKALRGVHHPVPSDDVLAGWRAALANRDLLGVGPERVHVGGASAGANLAAGLCLRLGAGAGPRAVSAVLVYPVVHSALPAPTEAAAAALATLPAELRFGPDFSRAINLNYVGSAEAFADPIAFPANGDARQMPPTLIINAQADDLRSSGEAFAAQLRAAGRRVTCEYEPNTRHGYLNEPENPGALPTIERIANWMLAFG